MGIIAEHWVIDERVHLSVHRATGLRRLTGLTARPELAPDAALRFTRCRSVHGFGMARPLDVVFADAGGVVTSVRPLAPWRCVFDRAAVQVFELRAGAARRLQITAGAQIKQLTEGEQ
ncbi:MAG: DUF192 domain-containing protein [Thermoleophilaceae bacterium]|nr:DUF192 domain-containing protein [Thermoleophilaceae bacterium]